MNRHLLQDRHRSTVVTRFFVVFLIGVNVPEIVVFVVQGISYCEDAGQHGVVLVVVPM